MRLWVKKLCRRFTLWSADAVPLEMQNLRSECGLACLAMVLGSYDRRTDLASLRRRFPGLLQGVSLKDLVGVAEGMHFLARGVRTEPQQLDQLQVPAILHWNLDHFVVLVRTGKRGCLIHDPARGRLWCSWNEMDAGFSGVALELWPVGPAGSEQQPERLRKFSYAALWRRVQGVWGQLAWIMVLSATLQSMVLAAPWHVQWTVDEALVTGDIHLVGALCLGFGLLLTCRVLTHLLRGLMVLHLGHLLSFQLACQLLSHLLRLPLAWFEHRHVGDITSRFASLQPIRELLTQGAAALVVDVLMVLLSLTLMLVYSPILALLVCVVHGVYLAVHQGLVPRLKQLGMGLVVAQAAEQSHLLQSVQAMHNVKLYTMERERAAQWQHLHGHTLTQSLQLQRQQLALSTGGLLVGGAELIGLIYLIAHEVLAGAFTLGMMFAFLSYRGHFTERLRGLTEQLVNVRTLKVHLQRVGELWAEPAETVPDSVGAAGEDALLDEQPHVLSLQQVSYRYSDKHPWLLKAVQLDIEPGELIVLVGASGCGKSTLLKLLMGLAVPSRGRVCWRQRVLLGEDALRLRRRAACVLQGDGFFSGSIVDNITLFAPPDLERVRDCLQQVGLTKTVASLPMALQTQVGDIGQSLSTGQLQRLLLARALYRQPEYLFLDEATANLDAASASAIHALVRCLTCTRVVVTHDVSFAACADRAFELRDGHLRQLPLPPKTSGVQSAE